MFTGPDFPKGENRDNPSQTARPLKLAPGVPYLTVVILT
jgi:hypothetical protein